MRPGDTIVLEQFRQTAAAAPATGKVLADFSFELYLDGVLTSVTKSVTEGATTADGRNRAYKWSITLPSTAGQVVISIPTATGTDVVYPDRWSGEIENADLDSLYAAASTPVTVTSATGSPTVDTPLIFDAYRYHDCSATRYTAAGVVQDLTGYTTPRFAVWDRTHSITIYSQSTGITLGGVAGTITWTVPENASFFSQIDAAITAGQDSVTLYYDLVADKGGVATQTQVLLRGTITLRRYEAAA